MNISTFFSQMYRAAQALRILVLLALLLLMGGRLPLSAQVTTFVGSGTAGFMDGTGAAAQFNEPRKAVIDGAGNLYIIDAFNHRIRRITPGGVVTTFAGSGTAGLVNATGTAAQFNFPAGIARDAAGNLYIADQANHAIRMITPGGVVTTLAGTGVAGYADGAGASAQFNNPTDVALNPAQNILYVADGTNQRVRAITLPGAVVTTLAGNGTFTAVDGIGTAAQLSPYGIAVDANGTLFVSDPGNERIRKITPEGAVTTLAGSTAGFLDGQGTSARFNSPRHLAIAPNGSLYVSDPYNNRIRTVSPSGMVSTLAGNGLGGNTNGAYLSSTFGAPVGVCVDAVGDVYIGGNANHNVRKISQSLPTISSFTPTSQYALQQVIITGTNFFGVTQVRFGGVNAAWFEVLSHTQIRAVVPTGAISGNVTATNNAGTGTLGGFTLTATPQVSTIGGLATVGAAPTGYLDAVGGAARFNEPGYVSSDAAGNLYVGDELNHSVRVIAPSGVVTTLAGSGTSGFTNGTGTAAQFNRPRGMARDAAGNVYVADIANHVIRKIAPGGVVTTLAGSGVAGFIDATGTAAQFTNPQDVALNPAQNILYVADGGNLRVRAITLPGGVVTTLAGSGTAGTANGVGAAAQFAGLTGVAVDANGNIFVCDAGNHRIRKITSEGAVTTLAGSTVGFADAQGTAAQFNSPRDISIAPNGTLYVGDPFNTRIRTISPSGMVSSLAGLLADGTTYDGAYLSSSFSNPVSVALDPTGNLYVGGNSSHNIRKITQSLPTVTSFAPTSAYPMQAVTITGTNFFGVTQVRFGGVNAAWFEVLSMTQIRAVVPTGAISGNVTATNNAGTGTQGGFTLTATPVVSTLVGDGTAGSLDAVGGGTRMNTPRGMVKVGGDVYFIDLNQTIRKLNLATQIVTTFAGSGSAGFVNGTGTAASFFNPCALATDGTNLYVSDENNHVIRRIVIASGVVTTLVGTGTAGFVDNLANATGVQFSSPCGLTCDGTYLYCADLNNRRIRRITLATGATETFAGSGAVSNIDGIGTAASFNRPFGITIDGAYLYVAGYDAHNIRRIDIVSRAVTTIAGSGVAGFAEGVGAAAQFNFPGGVASDGAGTLYVSDRNNNRVRTISLATNTVSTLAGNATAGFVDGTIAAGRLNFPSAILWDGTGAIVSDELNYSLRKIVPPPPTVTSFAPTSAYPMQVVTITGTNFTGATQVQFGGINAAWFNVVSATQINAVVPFGGASGSVSVVAPGGTASLAGFTLAAVPQVSTVAGNGTSGFVNASGQAARLFQPSDGVKVGSVIYFSDNDNHCIRKYDIATGAVTTIAGNGVAGTANGIGTAAQFFGPHRITHSGGNLYVSDAGSHRIRQIVIATGVVTTLAGSGVAGFANGVGAAAQFNSPAGLTTDGTYLYVCDYDNNRIRRIDFATANVTTIAGSGTAGNADGIGAAAQFNRPYGITYDGSAYLYVAGNAGNNVRRIEVATGNVLLIAGERDRNGWVC